MAQASVTDYKTPCGVLPLSFIQMLASCIITDASGNTYLNTYPVTGDCNDYTPLVNCDNANQDMEAMLVNNVFAVDECGNLMLKIFSNTVLT